MPLFRLPTGLARAALLALSCCLSGCLTADGILRADGTGTLALTWAAAPGTTEASQREMLKAPGVTVESLSIADRTVSAKLAVTDLTGIGKTALLKNVTVTKAAQGDAEVLTITVQTPPGRPPEDRKVPGPKIHLTLPGKVLEANERGVTDGDTVRWSFPLADWLARPKWELTVKYQAPKAAAAPSQGSAAPAAKAE